MSKGGIADRMIAFNGFPFLDNKEDHSFGVPVSTAMTATVTCLPASGLDMEDVHSILSENKFQGYPIVDDLSTGTLVGYIGRTELIYAINRVKREQGIAKKAKVYFTPTGSRSFSANSATSTGPAVSFETMAVTATQTSVDFSIFIDATPLTVHPRLPLETVMELFKKMGPRVILIEHRGKLAGLVTVKDCLKYQFKVEAQENPKDDNSFDESHEKIWKILASMDGWLNQMKQSMPRGWLRLRERETGRVTGTPERPNDVSSPSPRENIIPTELELEDR
jgi:chloride channel 3/4/5